MSSMFRLLRGEMHKILMRPILYVITGVLVLALFFSFTLLDMDNRNSDQYSINGETKQEVLQNFLSAQSMNKSIADDNLASAKSKIDYYATVNTDATTTITAQLKLLVTESQNVLVRYLNGIQTAEDTGNLSLLLAGNYRNQLANLTTQMSTIVSDSTRVENPTLLMKKTDYDRFVSLTSTLSTYLSDNSFDENNIDDHNLLVTRIRNAVGFDDIEGPSFIDKIETLVNQNMSDIVIDEEVITSLNEQYETASAYMNDLNSNITAAVNDEEVSLETMKDYVLSYYYTAKQMNDLATDSIYMNPIKNFNDSQANDYIGYSEVNTYEVNQEITRNNYLIANNLSDISYGHVFSPTTSFGNEVSAFDLVYFGLEICGFVILIFCVVLAAGMIAGEQSNGTLKVLAIRPYNRSKILTSKILATVIFGIIFIIFSALVLFIIGYAFYGLDMTSILAVFNASSAFVVSPIVLILIYIALMIVKILFYVLLATMISVVFRSNVGAVAISILLYFVSALFAVLFTSTYWYAFIPFAGIDLFKFFGGSFATPDNPIAIALSSPLFYNSNFIVSIVSVVITMLLFTIISYVVFKKREIK